MKKSIAGIGLVTFMAVIMFASGCKKNNSETETKNVVFLTQEIQKLDIESKAKVYPMVSGRAFWRYAKADGAAGWATFKFLSRFIGPGYGGAFGVAGAIGGSLLEGWESGDITFSARYYPPTGSVESKVDFSKPLAMGMLHNVILSEITTGESSVSFENEDDIILSSYFYITERLAEELGLELTEFRSSFSVNEYKTLVENKNMSFPINLSQEVNNGANKNICSYMNEYFLRVSGDNMELNKRYTDLFLENVANQSGFTDEEKYNIIANLSIFKNSIEFWKGLK